MRKLPTGPHEVINPGDWGVERTIHAMDPSKTVVVQACLSGPLAPVRAQIDWVECHEACVQVVVG